MLFQYCFAYWSFLSTGFWEIICWKSLLILKITKHKAKNAQLSSAMTKKTHWLCLNVLISLWLNTRESMSQHLVSWSLGQLEGVESHAWTLRYQLLGTRELHLRTVLWIITIFKQDGTLYMTMNQSSRFSSMKNSPFHKTADTCQRTHCDDCYDLCKLPSVS